VRPRLNYTRYTISKIFVTTSNYRQSLKSFSSFTYICVCVCTHDSIIENVSHTARCEQLNIATDTLLQGKGWKVAGSATSRKIYQSLAAVSEDREWRISWRYKIPRTSKVDAVWRLRLPSNRLRSLVLMPGVIFARGSRVIRKCDVTLRRSFRAVSIGLQRTMTEYQG